MKPMQGANDVGSVRGYSDNSVGTTQLVGQKKEN
jgi:hypothetical protein